MDVFYMQKFLQVLRKDAAWREIVTQTENITRDAKRDERTIWSQKTLPRVTEFI